MHFSATRVTRLFVEAVREGDDSRALLQLSRCSGASTIPSTTLARVAKSLCSAFQSINEKQETANAATDWKSKGVLECVDSLVVVVASWVESMSFVDDMTFDGFLETHPLLHFTAQKERIELWLARLGAAHVTLPAGCNFHTDQPLCYFCAEPEARPGYSVFVAVRAWYALPIGTVGLSY
jgi:hypothetical protein